MGKGNLVFIVSCFYYQQLHDGNIPLCICFSISCIRTKITSILSVFSQSLASLLRLWGVTQNSNKLLSLNHRGRFLSEGAQLVLPSRVVFFHPVKKDQISVFVQMHPSKTHKTSLLWPVHAIFLILSEILYLVAKGTEDTSFRGYRRL